MTGPARSELPLHAALPHRGRALLLDRIERHDERATTCVVEVGDDAWLARADGSVPAWIGIEYMAQCIAVHEGCRARAAGRPPGTGFLAGVRDARFERAAFCAGDSLRVSVERLRGRPGLGALAYQCEIRATGEPDASVIARAQLTVVLISGHPGQSAGGERP
jgi:predicted hotdog family 3-hydroxylacyl-ACP dehydratase